jgi:hypothetical protein
MGAFLEALGTLAAGVAGADLLVKKSNIAEYYRLSTPAVTSTLEDYKQAALYTAKESKKVNDWLLR